MRNEQLRTKSLDLLRFPLSIIIVIIHTFSINDLTIRGNILPLKSMTAFVELNHWIDGFLRGQSVPIYYFISGYVFFLGIVFTQQKYLNKIKNRIYTLLIPFIIWNLVAVGYTLVKCLPAFSEYFPASSQTQIELSLPRIVNLFWDAKKSIITIPGEDISSYTTGHALYPYNVALWFLRDLMIVVIFTPLIYLAIKKLKSIYIFTIGLIWFLEPLFVRGYICQITTALFFFSLGAYFSILQKDIISEFNKLFKLSILSYIFFGGCYVLMIHMHPSFAPWIKQMNVLCGLFFAYNISSYIIKHNICETKPLLVSSSFFLYITHTIINIDILKILIITIKPTSELAIIMTFILSVVVTITSLLLAYILIKKTAPKFLTFITGRK